MYIYFVDNFYSAIVRIDYKFNTAILGGLI